ncbi:MAG: thiolase family protein [Candidatus Micrarchaeota archaeon]|nr:thiolase family protein [Candidatus Micrarchaeota archaeon]MDE1823905.1 thiolase family protein [Candidatus Micrarchaeota archaeon]MDE1849319.1 thiolase family protein [Candidatus Micrarchaeota archaeon]
MSAIVDANITKFGKSEKNLLELAADAARPVIGRHQSLFEGREAASRIRVVIANSYAAEFNGISGVHLQIAKAIGLEQLPSQLVNNISASGATALHQADMIIKSGDADVVLVVGAEKMTHMPTKEITTAISTLLFEEERAAGLTLPSLAGLMATACISEFGISREDIANVAVQNRFNGSLNPNSYHFEKGVVTLEQVLESKMIVSPLRRFEFCPNADGAAALLVTSNGIARSFTDNPVFVRGIGLGADSALISSRKDLVSMPSVEQASSRAYALAGITPAQISIFEAHDMSTILQPMQMIAAGILNGGEAWTAASEGRTSIHGDIPVNTSGGLISCGHPIAVSGLKQAIEAYMQIRGEAGERQVKNVQNVAFASLGGFANSVVFTVLSKDGDERQRIHPAFAQEISYSMNGSHNGSPFGSVIDKHACQLMATVLSTTVSYATAKDSPDVVRLVVAQMHSGKRVIARAAPEQDVAPGDTVSIMRALDGVPELLRG